MMNFNFKNNSSGIKYTYLLVSFTIIFLSLILYFSFASFEIKTKKYNAAKLKVSDLSFTIVANNLNDNHIIVESNKIVSLDIEITNNNKINTNYELYYNSSSLVSIYKSINSTDDIFGLIESNGKKYIRLIIENNLDVESDVTFLVNAGYFYNELDKKNMITEVYPYHIINVNNESYKVDASLDANISLNSSCGDVISDLSCSTSNNYYYNENIGALIIENVNDEMICNYTRTTNIINYCNTTFNTKDNNMLYNFSKTYFCNKDKLVFDDYFYLKGEVENNYVKINDILFRIVGINSDGSTKLVSENVIGLSKIKSFDNVVESDIDGLLDYNELDSTKFIENYYNNNLIKYDDLIVEENYCYDISKTLTDIKYFGGYKNESSPLHQCLFEHYVTKKVGLLDVSTYVLSLNNDKTYLNNELITDNYWLLEPYKFDNNLIYNFVIKNKSISNDIANKDNGIRILINIDGKVIYNGDGTYNNPYTIFEY